MTKATEPTHITEARRELARRQRNAKFFASQNRRYRAEKSNLAQPYKIMAKLALSHVRYLKRSLQRAVALQERLDELTLRIAKLESHRK